MAHQGRWRQREGNESPAGGLPDDSSSKDFIQAKLRSLIHFELLHASCCSSGRRPAIHRTHSLVLISICRWSTLEAMHMTSRRPLECTWEVVSGTDKLEQSKYKSRTQQQQQNENHSTLQGIIRDSCVRRPCNCSAALSGSEVGTVA